ncbi:MAG: serine hydrolase [Flammeovirgaceae bacterium]|nr:serine hydrolase [Flammeovirgaceae bacterium]
MKKEPEKFQFILDNKDKLEVQVIYTQIERDANNAPTFISHYFNVDSSRYFYPASTVKLPILLVALEKLNALNISGLDMHTPMFNDSVYSGQLSVVKDSTSENGLPSIAHYGKKILIVSDNDASNRLYEFVGQKEVNEVLNRKGYGLRILHRLERFLTPDQNRHTEMVRFVRDNKMVYEQSMLVNEDSIIVDKDILKGKAHYQNGELVQGPLNFTYKNFYSLVDQQYLLRSLLFPESVEERYRFDLTSSDRAFVLQYMSQFPGETSFPNYGSDKKYYDAYCKFLMYGEDKESIPPTIRIFNKVGDAYGYLIDNAYIVDFENKIEFMLSAVIFSNEDGVFDGQYSYSEIGFPFMKNIGQLIYKYERDRKRSFAPDLSEFQLTYDKKRF